jgi:hypothetical protein
VLARQRGFLIASQSASAENFIRKGSDVPKQRGLALALVNQLPSIDLVAEIIEVSLLLRGKRTLRLNVEHLVTLAVQLP